MGVFTRQALHYLMILERLKPQGIKISITESLTFVFNDKRDLLIDFTSSDIYPFASAPFTRCDSSTRVHCVAEC
jgi:hypothetical protein